LLNTNELENLWILLRDYLDSREFSLLQQGRKYRVNKSMIKTESIQENSTRQKDNDPYVSSKINNYHYKSITPTILDPKYTLQINFGSVLIQFNQGDKLGKFVQEVSPNVIMRSDFFTDTTTRNKVISAIQVMRSTVNLELNSSSIISLIDNLWPVLK
jgi:hypothetical protein